MERNRPAPNAAAAFNRKAVCNLLDVFIAMRWDLSKVLRDDSGISPPVLDHVRRVDDELNIAIKSLRTLVQNQAAPLLDTSNVLPIKNADAAVPAAAAAER
jgi:hypothetical protein